MSYKITFEKYQSSGNDFIITENTPFLKLTKKDIIRFCDRKFGIGSDGLIILNPTNSTDIFELFFYNPDGSGDTLCGNGSLSTVDFILNKKNISSGYLKASDGYHKFNTNIKNDFIKEDGIHSITMNNCNLPEKLKIDNITGYFINTGAPHFVVETDNLAYINIFNLGKHLRNIVNIENGGTNVDFISSINMYNKNIINDENNKSQEHSDSYECIESQKNNIIKVHTFEKGVENETLSCGTGSVASAIIYLYKNDLIKKENLVKVQNKGGYHYVFFKYDKKIFYDITLFGKPVNVFTAEIYND